MESFICPHIPESTQLAYFVNNEFNTSDLNSSTVLALFKLLFFFLPPTVVWNESNYNHHNHSSQGQLNQNNVLKNVELADDAFLAYCFNYQGHLSQYIYCRPYQPNQSTDTDSMHPFTIKTF